MGVITLVVGVGAGILSFKYKKEIEHGISTMRDNIRKRIEYVRTREQRLNTLEELSNKIDKKQAEQLAQIEELKRKQDKIDKEHAERRVQHTSTAID